ncbi:hypothetical protein [Litchfieldia alkalitelluris]|uniref:hypothetical protein n=1 Tax=Litchfieldia alkalitelluris TaxID=304268 RepID=UPI000997551D|nr:hypothetical protein [Litchfieldia alkalitelluris]
MNFYNRNQIGTAWHGRHIVMIRCNPFSNQFLHIDKSLHAPTEPSNENCAETVAQYFSIGYTLVSVTPISHNEVQYMFVK